jgi:heat shock protein HtpX
MSNLTDYQVGAADWRKQLRKNDRKTRVVIAMFLLIYTAIGFIIDLYLHAGTYTLPNGELVHVPVSAVAQAIFHGQLIPYATIILAVIALVAILVTFAMHDKLMLLGTEYFEVTPETARTLAEKQLYNIIEEMKTAAGLKYMPKVYVIEADYMNAFASGYSEKSAMVAITQGLIEKLNRSELQAVMAHELSHIRHHDIKLTLMASVLANIMLMVVDLLFYGVVFGDRERRDNGLATIIIILRFVLPITTVLLLLYLSRTREYMADAGAVELTRDNTPLANALLKISGDHEAHSEHYAQEYLQTPHEDVRRAAYIYDPVQAGIEPIKSIATAFSTHPAMEDRLKALGIKRHE